MLHLLEYRSQNQFIEYGRNNMLVLLKDLFVRNGWYLKVPVISKNYYFSVLFNKYGLLTIQKRHEGTGEMAQRFRTFATLVDLDSLPSIHMVAYIICNCRSRGSDVIIWALRASGTCVV